MWKTGTPQMATVLASANRIEAGSELLKVSVYLTSPSTLFYRQRIRVGWFASLILAATVAACIGLTAAWRSFQRQLRLSELKSNFVSSVSHELRAPIAFLSPTSYLHHSAGALRRAALKCDDALIAEFRVEPPSQSFFRMLSLSPQTSMPLRSVAAEAGLRFASVRRASIQAPLVHQRCP